MGPHHTPRHRRPRPLRTAVVAVTVAATALIQVGTASAQDLPFDRGVTDACVAPAMEADQFDDVHLGQVHAGAIDCLWVYGIARGRSVDGGNVYAPAEHVNRQQMASLVARTLMELPDRYYTLPDADDDAPFDDADGIASAHVRNVAALHEAGIVEGFADGTYRPHEAVNRGQMASFIARSIEAVLQEELPRTTGVFDDVAGNEHEAAIEKLATAGIVQGRDGASYHPQASTTRAQMASFVARTMDYLVNAGVLIAMGFARGTGTSHHVAEVLVDPYQGGERVTFELAGDDGTAGWRMRYVDAAIQDGSGFELDVAGDAIIEVVLTGTAPPDPELDLDTFVDGDAVVEVVDGGWFEGRHQLFVGTTGIHGFGALQLDDPRRVALDIFPG